MGFAISWLAVSGKSPDRVLAELGFAREGSIEELPESAFSATLLASGWYLVYSNRFNSPLVAGPTLRSLSLNCQVLACQAEEHVMFSSATCFENGELLWHVEHDAQESILDLRHSGELPPEFPGILASLKQQQDEEGGADSEVDYIHEVPLCLAKSLIGFKHDEQVVEDGAQPFEVLLAARGPAKPWWKIW